MFFEYFILFGNIKKKYFFNSTKMFSLHHPTALISKNYCPIPDENMDISDHNDNFQQCTICLLKMNEDEPSSYLVRHSNCKHLFHSSCIWEWRQAQININVSNGLFERRPNCPVCRAVGKVQDFEYDESVDFGEKLLKDVKGNLIINFPNVETRYLFFNLISQ